jgi:hypothetical protein
LTEKIAKLEEATHIGYSTPEVIIAREETKESTKIDDKQKNQDDERSLDFLTLSKNDDDFKGESNDAE